MQNKETWKINRSKDFNEIERLDIHLQIGKDGYATVVKDEKHIFKCKPISSFRFLFKRYPIMVISTIILSIIFLWIHTVAFFIYAILSVVIFTIAVRLCSVDKIGTYIMVFWIVHFIINFIILGGGSLSAFSIVSSNKQYYIQALFFGMLLTHIWIYLIIFLQQYYHVFEILDEIHEEEVKSTNWYIWKSCGLCNKKYNPFSTDCDTLI